MNKVIIYTDGSCLGNPGPGGYGVVMLSGELRKELSGGFRLTTNNRMEMMACIAALESLKVPCQVTIYTDSSLIAKAFSEGWIQNWRAKGWRNAAKQPIANQDLWRRLMQAVGKHEVKFYWLESHNGHEHNERADQLASIAAREEATGVDAAYESNMWE